MTSILTKFPTQLSVRNYAESVVVDPENPDYWTNVVGQYAKIEGYQMNLSLAANHTHMPNPYQPNNAAHANTVFGELDRKRWMRGILLSLDWGRIETSAGVFNWNFTDFVMNTIRGLQRTTGQNKRVFLLINLRHVASLTGLDTFIPEDLLTQPAANGGWYRPTAQYSTTATNPMVNVRRYDHMWAYEGLIPDINGNGVGEPKGYNFNNYKFVDPNTPNTLQTRFYAFIDAIAERYLNDEVFAGIVTVEAAIGIPFTSIINGVERGFEVGNGRDPNYNGRKQIAKKLRSAFPGKIVAECLNFDTQYYRDMTNAGVTDGLIANKLAFTNANIYTGTNMNLGNIRPVLAGKVPIVSQIQPFDWRTRSGNRPQYYNWPTNPTQVLSGDGINDNDPATPQWLFDRVTYYLSNCVIIQRNFQTGGNWDDWKAFMDAGPHANSPFGGMVSTRPQFVG